MCFFFYSKVLEFETEVTREDKAFYCTETKVMR